MLDRYKYDAYNYLSIADKAQTVIGNKDRLMFEVSSEAEVRGFGNGYEYTPEMAASLLNWPYSNQVSMLSKKGREFFKSKRLGKRASFEPVGTSVVNEPYWYFQGPEPTCGPWALASIALNLQRPLSATLMSKMLNESNNVNSTPESRKMVAHGLVTEGPGLLPDDLEYMLNGSNENVRISHVLPSWPELNSYPDFIAGVIKSGRGAILELVEAGEFYGLPDIKGRHFIGIVGFDTTPRGINLQVLDSNLGELIVPAEHVYSSRSGGLSVVRGR